MGTVKDGDETIDEIVVGCESRESFAIHCHGNPLIVEMIMQLLARCGAELTNPRRLLTATLTADEKVNTIGVEARLAQLEAKTLEGTRILENQIDKGLSQKAGEWLGSIKQKPISEIAAEAESILENSRVAKLIISGCTAVLLGPANTGKSTLLNCLSGREKAIVADISGTTRDWVSANCRIEPLCIELIDTAGVDEKLLSRGDDVDKAAQKKAVEMINRGDLILFVLDGSGDAGQVDEEILKRIADKKVIAVINKSDLPAKLNTKKLPGILGDTVEISAKLGTNIDRLCEKILLASGATDFDPNSTAAFTARQEGLLRKLIEVKDRDRAALLITELLKANSSV